MKRMVIVCLALTGFSAMAEFEVPGRPEGVPELSAKSVSDWEAVERPRLMRIFMEEEYGVRPVERPADLRFAETAAPETCLGGRAIRKRVKAMYSGPGGEAAFDFSVWIPKANHPVAVFVHSSPRPAETADDVNGPRPIYWLPVEDIVSRGYAVVAYCNQEVALDWQMTDVATGGVFKAFGNADLKNRKPTEWGVLSAWAWGDEPDRRLDRDGAPAGCKANCVRRPFTEREDLAPCGCHRSALFARDLLLFRLQRGEAEPHGLRGIRDDQGHFHRVQLVCAELHEVHRARSRFADAVRPAPVPRADRPSASLRVKRIRGRLGRAAR